jgi:hypothetical protein
MGIKERFCLGSRLQLLGQALLVILQPKPYKILLTKIVHLKST